jgi:hypothetical protein
MTKEKAKILSKVNITPARFSFDGPSQSGHIGKAIKTCIEAGWPTEIYIIYLLANYDDKPEFFKERLSELHKLKEEMGGKKLAVVPLVYMNYDKEQIPNGHWTEEQIRQVPGTYELVDMESTRERYNLVC